ncbi:MAG: peptidase M15 [Actinophytocola sp.]|nr:peptidase M15 [Actinophytocola sp.]
MLSAVVVTLLSALLLTPTAAAKPDDCSYRPVPPPPVDSSEVPKPGEPSPTPLPVPDTPPGGERMAECGHVLPGGVERPKGKITAKAWLLADLDDGTVLAAKNPHGRQRPASLIKVLLALAVMDELGQDDVVTASAADASQECSCVGIVKGQQYTVDRLFTSLLLRSGNDVAHALGSALGGNDQALAKMNQLAAGLGAVDTRAATTSGLDGPGMTSSAYDLALIFRAALAQPRFVEAVGTHEMTFKRRERKRPVTIYNDNTLLHDYPGFLGGKTGFTNDARHTYLGAAERGGRRLAVVMLRAEQHPMRVTDQAKRLLNYGFRLSRQDVEPVGTLVEPTRDASLRPREDPTTRDAEPDDVALDDEPTQAAATEGPGGATREIVVLVLIAVALITLLVLHRKTRR